MKAQKITVIRTAVGSPPVASLIIDLQSRGVRVVGLDSNPLSAGFFLCDAHYIIPKAKNKNFLKEFLKICDREKPTAVISGPEAEIVILAKNKKLFAKRGILLLVPDYQTAKICADKVATNNFFKKENIPIPQIYSQGKVRFPAIIKPRFGGGSSQVYKVEDKIEFDFYIRKVPRPVIQEFIRGDEYTIDVLADVNSNPLSIVPRLRISTESGISMKGRTVNDLELINYCSQIVKKLKIIGPSCIQCIKNKQGIYFLEINTRFGGGSNLSQKADPSILDNLLRLIKGRPPVKSRGFKDNLTMLRYYSEVYREKL